MNALYVCHVHLYMFLPLKLPKRFNEMRYRGVYSKDVGKISFWSCQSNITSILHDSQTELSPV